MQLFSDMNMGVEKVAVLGAGLLGGSIAAALKERGFGGLGKAVAVSVWSRSKSTRLKCSQMGRVFDEVCETPAQAVSGADLAVVCTPTDTIAAIVGEIAPHLKAGAVVTDVGSVKSAICRDCSAALAGSGADFVGSHPMAGSEKIGVDFADGRIFDGRVCIVVPCGASGAFSAELVRGFWESLGMRVEELSPAEHDRIVAHVSHAPHMLAGTLCRAVEKLLGDFALQFAGPGFRDCTRVVSGSPDIWDAICMDNRAEITAALKEYRECLDSLISDFDSGNFSSIASALREAKAYRDKLGGAS